MHTDKRYRVLTAKATIITINGYLISLKRVCVLLSLWFESLHRNDIALLDVLSRMQIYLLSRCTDFHLDLTIVLYAIAKRFAQFRHSIIKVNGRNSVLIPSHITQAARASECQTDSNCVVSFTFSLKKKQTRENHQRCQDAFVAVNSWTIILETERNKSFR